MNRLRSWMFPRTSPLSRVRRWLGGAALILWSPIASAQSIGEVIEKHLEENLEDDEGVAKKEQKQEDASEKKKDKKPTKKSKKSRKSKKSGKKKNSSPDSPKPESRPVESKPDEGQSDEAKSEKSASQEEATSSSKSSVSAKTRSSSSISGSRPSTSSRSTRLKMRGKRYHFLALAKKPPRIIGENFEFDPQVGFGLRGWHSDDYPSLKIGTQQYPQWYVGFHGRFFKRIRIYRAFYQSVGLKSPRNTGAVIAAKASKAAPGAATKAMGMMGYQVKLKFIPMIRYEARSYEATAVPQQPLRVIPFGADLDDDPDDYELTEDELTAVSTFETFILGVHYNDRLKDENGDFIQPAMLPFHIGVGFTQYRKPYQVNVGDAVLDEFVFNAHFRGAGLATGFDINGGIDKLGIKFAAQAGLGQIRLTEDDTLNELLPDDWWIGYLQGDLKVDYTVDLLHTKPTTLLLSPVASFGGTSFYYIKKNGEGDAPLANWDLLWMAMARLIVPL